VDKCPENWLFHELCWDPGWLSCPAGGSRQLAQGGILNQELGSPLLLSSGLAHTGEQSKTKWRHMAQLLARSVRGCGGWFSEHHAEGAFMG